MDKKDLSKKLSDSKVKLQDHLEKFNSLRDQGKSKEALEELKVALNFAQETLQYSNSILRQIHNELTAMPLQLKKEILQKIDNSVKLSHADKLLNIHVPEKKIIH